MIIDKRPNLNKNISIKDYYWLKEELTTFCREIGITSVGGKIDITNRIKKSMRGDNICKNQI